MLNEKELETRAELIRLHKELLEQHDALRQIECSDKDFDALIRSIQVLLEKSADLIAETAVVFLPVNEAEPKKPFS